MKSLTVKSLDIIAELARKRIDAGLRHHGEQWRLGGRTAINFILKKIFLRATEQESMGETDLVLQALVASGYVDPEKVEQAREIMRPFFTNLVPDGSGVPFPETFRPDSMGCMDPCNESEFPLWVSLEDAISYGNARVSAAYAKVKVPEGLGVAIINAAREYENPRIPFRPKDKAQHAEQVKLLLDFAATLITDQMPQASNSGGDCNRDCDCVGECKVGTNIASIALQNMISRSSPETQARSRGKPLPKALNLIGDCFEVKAYLRIDPAMIEPTVAVMPSERENWSNIGYRMEPLATLHPPIADADVRSLASKTGVFYHDGRVYLGAPLYAFSPTELITFARKLTGGDHA